MRKELILVMIVIMSFSVSALSATVLTPKVVTRVNSTGEYQTHLVVRNDNNVSVNVTLVGFDNKLLFVSNPIKELSVNETYDFAPLIRLASPINTTYNLELKFADSTQVVSVNAKWVLLSEFESSNTNTTNIPEPERNLFWGMILILSISILFVWAMWRFTINEKETDK
jgi:hypothetical protein